MLDFIEKYYDELSSIVDELLKKVRGRAEDYINYFYEAHLFTYY
jgi:hypothetical protein